MYIKCLFWLQFFFKFYKFCTINIKFKLMFFLKIINKYLVLINFNKNFYNIYNNNILIDKKLLPLIKINNNKILKKLKERFLKKKIKN